MTNTEQKQKEIERLYQSYRDYSANLRTWFVGYGVGVPVFILTKDSLEEYLRNNGELKSVLACFFAGIALQIILSALNKQINWHCYQVDWLEKKPEDFSWVEKKSKIWIDYFWIDLVADLLTLALFLYPLVHIYGWVAAKA